MSSDELHVFTNDTDCTIARDFDDIPRTYSEIGSDLDFDADEWTRLPPSHVERVWIDRRTGKIGEHHGEHCTLVDVTCADLIKRHGRGFLCSTEY